MRQTLRPGDLILGLVLAAYLLPIWWYPRIPTQDGPSHVYNAFVLAQLLSGQAETGPVADTFAVRWEPVPNWTGHALLAGLMMLGVSPIVAEKLVVSAYLVGVALATRYLLRGVSPDQDAWTPLALPLALNFPFFMGFTNFLVGIPVALALWGLAWRWRDDLTPRRAGIAAGLLVVLYLAHLVDVVVGGFTLAVLLLLGAPRRRRTFVWLAAAGVPGLALVGWYVTQSDPDYLDKAPLWKVVRDSTDTVTKLLGRFVVGVVAPTPWHDARLGLAAVGLLAVGVVVASIRAVVWQGREAFRDFGRTRGAFAIAAAELLALGLLFPQHWGRHGGVFTERIAVFVGLLSLAWLPAPRSRSSVVLVRATAVALALLALAGTDTAFRQGNAELAQLLDPIPPLPARSRILPLLLNPQPVDVILLHEHAMASLALQPGVVDWSNYEAQGFCFPIRFRPGVDPPDLDAFRIGQGPRIEADLARTDVVLTGPALGEALRATISRSFPVHQRAGSIDVYSRTELKPATRR